MTMIHAVDGTELYVEDWGHGTPIVFIHGWPLSSAMWEYQRVPLTAAGFRTIAYDRRGFGRSEQPYGDYSYKTLAGDLRRVIEERDLSGVTLVGFSMGGGEVAEYLSNLNGDGRVNKAMLISSVAPYLVKAADNPDGVPHFVFAEMRKQLEADRPAFLTEFTEKFFGADGLFSGVSSPMLAASCEIAMQASPYATLACTETFSETDFRAGLKNVQVPTLVIHGDNDTIVPIDPTGKCAAEIMPNAELKIYSGAPHGLFYTHRHELNDDIAAFVSDGRVVLDYAGREATFGGLVRSHRMI